MDMEELVNKAKTGDKDAYTNLIKSIENDLYKIAISILKNEDDAQDAIQETVINAYLGISKVRNAAYFKTWITRILINKCKHIYKSHKKKDAVIDKCTIFGKTFDNLDDRLVFEDMLNHLDKTQKEIFELFYKHRLSTRQIAKELGMNENTIKTALHRGRLALKKIYKPSTIFMFILCMLLVTSVIAVSIISYIKGLFGTNDVGIENSQILMAIERLDWYQEVNMDYIDLGDGNKLKIEYLLMDEMNLYMIFDFDSEDNISKYKKFSLPDLVITNENGDVICDKSNVLSEQSQIKIGNKVIETSKHHMKSLAYMYTNSLPVSKTLNIDFSKVVLYTRNKEKIINCDINFKIDLAEKFINRNHVTYSSDNPMIKKAIVSETGFYAILETDDFRTLKVKLVDYNGVVYDCYISALNPVNTSDTFKHMIIANFNNLENKTLKLIIENNSFELLKTD